MTIQVKGSQELDTRSQEGHLDSIMHQTWPKATRHASAHAVPHLLANQGLLSPCHRCRTDLQRGCLPLGHTASQVLGEGGTQPSLTSPGLHGAHGPPGASTGRNGPSHDLGCDPDVRAARLGAGQRAQDLGPRPGLRKECPRRPRGSVRQDASTRGKGGSRCIPRAPRIVSAKIPTEELLPSLQQTNTKKRISYPETS